MISLSFLKLRPGIWQVLLVLFLTSYCLPLKANPINTINIDNFNEFLLLDNTLLLNAGAFPTSDEITVRADYGRAGIRALSVRRNFGREMIRMGREFSLFLGGRAIPRTTYNPFLLRANQTLNLRRDLSIFSVRNARDLIRGRYLLGARRSVGGRASLFANFSIFGDDLVWSVTDEAGDKVFAMSRYQSVPEPAGLLLFISGLVGLTLVMCFRPRSQRQSTS